MTTDRVVMSTRRSPSARCTRRTYTGPSGAPTGRAGAPAEHQDGAGDAGADDQMRRTQVAEGQRGSTVGDPGHPGDQQARRHVDHRRGRAADESGHEAGRKPPHHHRRGRWHGERVGEEPSDRGAAERADEDGRHADLGGDRDREHLAQEQRAGQAVGDRRCQQHDAGRRRDRQLEAHGVDQQGVDEDQAGHGQCEETDARRLASRGGGRREPAPPWPTPGVPTVRTAS